jgi:hypothetical protein
MTARRAAFERAVADCRLPDLAPPAKALAVAAASLDRTGLFLLGEAHGVAQTPLAILGLAQRLGARALAFEWSYEIEGQGSTRRHPRFVLKPQTRTGSPGSSHRDLFPD